MLHKRKASRPNRHRQFKRPVRFCIRILNILLGDLSIFPALKYFSDNNVLLPFEFTFKMFMCLICSFCHCIIDHASATTIQSVHIQILLFLA